MRCDCGGHWQPEERELGYPVRLGEFARSKAPLKFKHITLNLFDVINKLLNINHFVI